MIVLFDVLARLPLWMLHRIGALLGWLIWLSSRRYSSRLRENLRLSGVAADEAALRRLLRINIREMGKGVTELPWVWRRPFEEVVASVQHCHGWDHFEAAQAQGKGVIMLTPHIGCFEIIALFVAARTPMTSMYRVPRWRFLDTLMHEGRERGQMKLAPADLRGVRQLLKALKKGQAIGILPDQAPGNGEGEWAPFFGRPAYTMTLIGKLMESSGAPVVMCACERLPHGEGYALYFTPLSFEAGESVPVQLNRALEQVILRHPGQYLWSYNRYKVPRGALPPQADGEQ